MPETKTRNEVSRIPIEKLLAHPDSPNRMGKLQALRELGYKIAEVMVWDIDDREADMLLASINRLRGSDVLDKKLTVLNRLNRRMRSTEMTKVLPFSRTQIERLAEIGTRRLPPIKPARAKFADPLVFFVDSGQKKIIENALSLAREKSVGRTKAETNATALALIAEQFNLKLKENSNSEKKGNSHGG